MHFLSMKNVERDEILFLIKKAREIKSNPLAYYGLLTGKTLLMFFAKPSLRTRVSFEVAMSQLGGHAIYYDISTSPLGKGKEDIKDTASVISRYCDIIMARLFEHKEIEDFASASIVPVINGLTNFAHPCQVMADLMTIQEKKGEFSELKISYLGDGNNNVTHCLLFGCPKLGMKIYVATPGGEFAPQPQVISYAKEYAKKYNAEVVITSDPEEAASDADIVVTDSWMSYHIPKDQEQERIKLLTPYQVNQKIMALAKKDAIFMHCMPATRGHEVTADVIDGAQSAVLDEAENRLHIQKAIILWLLGKL